MQHNIVIRTRADHSGQFNVINAFVEDAWNISSPRFDLPGGKCYAVKGDSVRSKSCEIDIPRELIRDHNFRPNTQLSPTLYDEARSATCISNRKACEKAVSATRNSFLYVVFRQVVERVGQFSYNKTRPVLGDEPAVFQGCLALQNLRLLGHQPALLFHNASLSPADGSLSRVNSDLISRREEKAAGDYETGERRKSLDPLWINGIVLLGILCCVCGGPVIIKKPQVGIAILLIGPILFFVGAHAASTGRWAW